MSDKESSSRHDAMGRKTFRDVIASALPWLMIMAGLSILAWFLVADWIAVTKSEQVISEVTSAYDGMSDESRIEFLSQARAYNDLLSGAGDAEFDGEVWDYSYQLSLGEVPGAMMAWVDIPKISVRLPIFHGTEDDVLSAGVGHLEWSALPVGGVGTRCVLSAHSGMDGARMFDDLRELEVGDTFTMRSLSESYNYRICEIETVLPEDVKSLEPVAGRDLATLVTCTPLGVNTHRLCVTGERYFPSEDEDGNRSTTVLAAYANGRTGPFLAGVAVVACMAIVLLAMRMRVRHGHGRDADGTGRYHRAKGENR